MVSQGLGFWSHWIFRLWLCWWSCGPQVNIWHMPFPRMILGMLVLEEAKLRITLYYWSWVHCCWILLCSIAMDEANPQGLWHQCEECDTLLRQWKRHQDCQQPSSALEDKAHSDPSSLSQRSCHEGRYWYHSRQHWRAIGRYLHKALGWEKVLQVAVWAKYLGILKCPVIMHTS